MNIIRQHPYLISLAALLVILPVPVFAVGEDLVFTLVTTVFGLFVRLAAMLLNFSINHFVIDFGGVYANTGVGYAVDTTWIIIRDFVNMGFIFGFVYIGFKMILNSNDSNTRRWLVNILLAALLVNFSLFITKFVVDFSNQIAAQIVVNGLGGEFTTNTRTGLAEVDLGQSFMDRMGLTSIWENVPEGVGWGYIFGSALLFMITTFVFAAGGILLIIRFAVLNLFLVLSPLMFLSWILPGLKDTMNRYWSGFLGRAFFAPVYLLFIYFSLQIISGLQVAVGSGASNLANPSWAGTFQAVGNAGARNVQESTLGTLPFFVLICVFMIASLVIAQKMGADGGDRAVALGKTFSNKVRRTAVRQTAGRGLRVAGAVASTAEGSLNRRLGTMAQGGAASRATARFLDRTAGAGLRSTQNASAAGSESYSARNTRVGQQNTRLNQINQENRRTDTTNTQRDAYDTAVANGNVAARRDANTAMGAQMRRMSNDEILAMIQSNPDLLQQAGFVQHLTDAQMTAIRDSGMMTNDEHAALGNLRNESTINETAVAFGDVNATADELNNAFAELGQTLRNMSAERKAGLGINQLTDDNLAVHLSDRDLEGIEQSGRYTAVQMQQIREARGRGHAAIAGGTRQLATGNVAVAQEFFGQQRRDMMSNAQQAGQMPVDVFTNQNMQEYLTPDAVTQRLRNGVTQVERDAIRDNIDDYISSAPSVDEQRRRTQIWQKAAQGGANSSWISGLALRNI